MDAIEAYHFPEPGKMIAIFMGDDMYNYELQKQLNEKHAKNPRPGDYWSEMMVGICVVLEVDDGCVIFCSSKTDVDDRHWTWDLEQTDIKTIDEFNNWLSYDSIPGYWCDVHPEHHKWALSAQ